MLIAPYRIWAIMLRHLKPTFRDPIRYMDNFYWPLLDIILFGLTGISLVQSKDPKTILPLLTGLVLWQVVFRSNMEVVRNLLEEIWHQNLTNLFSTPLRLSEWMLAVMGLGILYTLFTLLFGWGTIYLIYGLNIFSIGIWILWFYVHMLLWGWTLGFAAAGVIIILGKRAEMLAWSLGWLFAPFVGVFYPVDVLPTSIQRFSFCLPPTYCLEQMRSLIKGNFQGIEISATGTLLNLIYLLLAIAFFRSMFSKSQSKGLGRLA